ncbi:MAG: permease [Pseudomonadota bacterium]|nr:permease [Pseudomonadota bacterium]
MLESYLHELWQVMLDLSPSLLLGLFIAGLMHVYLPKGFIHRGLNRPDMRSVTRASLIGVPLPLCSCGVIPTALGLRNEGASKGATTAFMISTPQTGVDSILVSASFLGWPFALFKLAAAFVTGLIGGGLVNRFTKRDQAAAGPPVSDTETTAGGIKAVLRYALFDLLGAIDLWIIAGVLAAALITTFVPTDYLAEQSWTQGVLGMLLVLAISIPLYVCTTGSVPIAASLIAAGMPAGTALVFLMAGPATNVATLGAVHRALGARVLLFYLGTVVVMSILLGLMFEFVLEGVEPAVVTHEHGPEWIGIGSAVVLTLLLAVLLLRRLAAMIKARRSPVEGDLGLTLKVEGMSCQHCVANVKKTLEGFETVAEASPSLSSGLVRVRGDHLDVSALVQAVEKAGYQVSETRGA